MASSNKNIDTPFHSPSFAKLYRSAEKITGPFADKLLKQAGFRNIDTSKQFVIQDNACGTGILTERLLDILDESSKAQLKLECTDIANAMIGVVKQKIEDSNWKGVKAFVVDAQNTNLPSSHYTHIFTHFGIMLFPDSDASLRESYRMLRPNGLLGLSTWNAVGWQADNEAAFAQDTILPPFPTADQVGRIMASNSNGTDWTNPNEIDDVLKRHGFEDIDVRVVPMSITMDDVNEYLAMMPGVMKMLLSRMYTREEMETYETRANQAVEKYMKEKYGGNPVTWLWTANLTTARRPSDE